MVWWCVGGGRYGVRIPFNAESVLIIDPPQPPTFALSGCFNCQLGYYRTVSSNNVHSVPRKDTPTLIRTQQHRVNLPIWHLQHCGGD